MTYYELNQWEQPLTDLEAWGRRPNILHSYVVPSESRDIAHLVREVGCLTVPFAEADVVADKTTIYICSCEDFKYNRWYDEMPEEIQNTPLCKHVGRIKTERAQNDDNQTTLEQ